MGINFVENNKNLTDNEVILLINKGEYENFKILINRYLPLVISLAKKYSTKILLEDAVQEGLIALFLAAKAYDPQKSAFPNFASVCVNRAMIAFTRKLTAQKVIPDELMQTIKETDFTVLENPESIFIAKESYNDLANSIKLELSKMEYKVLELFLEGKTYLEIAQSLDITEKAVDNALVRIRKKIKN